MAHEKRKAGTEPDSSTKKAKTNHGGAHPQRAQRFEGNGQHSGKDFALNGKTLLYVRGKKELTTTLGTSSRETHQKQKLQRQERIAAKPNSDSIARSKKIWERLRIKSAVSKDERKKLVDELFQIITGRVKDFVFKHDSVRVIQCALKYATPAQKQAIAEELRGSYRELAESKYAKFLIAKMIVVDPKVRDLVVPEFYGHVKRLIRHPEASWIMDDIYRAMATPDQKARLLREWYGAEFVVFDKQDKDKKITADLGEILKESPGKRGHVLQHLKEMTNQLVQKKTTGFTMLHDALLQYFLNCTPESPEHTEFLEMLRDDEEGDLFKNLAFTKSGSRLVCLALAYGNSKDRRTIMKHFKTHIKLLACDPYGHHVITAAYEVIDDTVMTAKAIIPELVGKDLDSAKREEELLNLVSHINGRIPLIYLLGPEAQKWLLDQADHDIIAEIRTARSATSKKDPATRRTELARAISQPLLDFAASQVEALLQTSFGCQFLGEALVGGIGEKEQALSAVADLAKSEEAQELLKRPHAGRLYKMLAAGGRFDSASKTIIPAEPPLGFSNKLYDALAEHDRLVTWAAGPNAWTLVALIENNIDFESSANLKAYLQKHRAALDPAEDDKAAQAGTKVLLEKIGTDQKNARDSSQPGKVKKSKKRSS